uniref:PSD1 and planctomycete cytochrome C domain-containing protein n=1 Tax=Rubripirellula amarantea TaxID=2527999 RepID=UPI001F5ED640|nr:PSD1 and planctomycete cytochrome C domain-containing protein [Rubripirellula amarantea]
MTADEASRATTETIDFTRHVQPILAKHCYACHGPDVAESGLRFTSQEAAYAEADSGEFAIVPGDVDASEMIARILSDEEDHRMPPEGDRLTASQIQTLQTWIEQGATWNKHWAFEPMRRVSPPDVESEAWNGNPIDAFVFDSLKRSGLDPNPLADRHTLVRRVYYDLTGLPPTADQVKAFVDDPDPNAFSKLVDQLLESHHYGEHWGRHWLDLVRYAETNSYERDGVKPNAWKYRDYVIKSFNDDKPYDQFVREQLAGDELEKVTTETLTATGYYRLGVWDDEPADPLQARFDGFDDIITTTSQVFLGLTVNCARCHDHKIDPIPQTDYYGMLAFFADVTPWGVRGQDPRINNQIDVSSEEVNRLYRENDAKQASLKAKIHEIEQAGIAKMSGPDQRATEGNQKDRKRVLDKHLRSKLANERWKEYQSLKKQLKAVQELAKEIPPRQSVMGLARLDAHPEQTFVLFRGNPHSPADPQAPSYPTILDKTIPEIPVADESAKSAGRRRVLADWIVDPENNMTARVMANRLWQFHFGRGIVRSSNNFGQLGVPPTHPELLDWLGHRLIDEGWKLKSMHRLIMNSRTYQLSSQSSEPAVSRDPNNDLFWRFDPRRLRAEEVRDSMLASIGVLNRTPYGPSFYAKLSKEVLAGQSVPGSGWGDASQEQRDRRSVYIHVKRSLLTPLLTAFDFPDPDLTCEERFATLQPGQALALLNGDFAHEQAARLSQAIYAAESENAVVVRRSIQALLQREPTKSEIEKGGRLIESLVAEHGLSRERAVQLYCLSVMNWNEFLFLD